MGKTEKTEERYSKHGEWSGYEIEHLFTAIWIHAYASGDAHAIAWRRTSVRQTESDDIITLSYQ